MLVSQKEAFSLLSRYSIPVPFTQVITDDRDLSQKDLKYPLALKVDSEKIIHKTDEGGVLLNINDFHELETKINELKRKFNSPLVVQQMIKGKEFILGMKRDPIFGPTILFGIGGIYVELLKDVSLRIAPLTKKVCFEMMAEIRASRYLEAYRNTTAVNKSALADTMIKLSRMALAQPDLIEIDFNPVIVNEEKAYVVDARLIRDA